MARILLLDIETTQLSLDFGHIMCVGFKGYGESPVHVPSVRDYPTFKKAPWDDTLLMRDLYEVVKDCDLLVTYFGKQFDWPALQTRMLKAGLPPLESMGSRHVDMYWTAKRELRLHSNRLESVMDFLDCPVKKTKLSGPIWDAAASGDGEALDYVIEHCRNDVLGLEWVYERLRPYIRQHPVVAGRGSCRVCGSASLQFRGYAALSNPTAKVKHRVQCQNCGAWDQRYETSGTHTARAA